ncbi:YppG family protein [Bacillus kwashiorkori]|uniref:YppG family protein n=1 Tax=Bacillus kwashiorkori TaxID=1522318 RepID=UPI000781F06D|nr:YppG family protein [Bacillus kwashiorkori]
MYPYRQPGKRPFIPPHHNRSLLRFFQTDDGRLDFEKISKSLNEANKIIGQVDPLVRKINSLFKN